MNEMIKVEATPPAATPADLLQMAVSQNADLNKLEKLMELQERWEANEARKAYYAAMSRFKANPPTIFKDTRVNFTSQKGTTDYRHATLANVSTAIGSELSKYGLTASWSTEQFEKKIKVTCRVTHELGYFESTSLEALPDETGNKNPIQAIGSTVTYLERYTILALTGLATHDQDNDGGKSVKTITEKQTGELVDMINDTEADESRFLEYMGVKVLADIPESKYHKAVAALNAKKKKGVA